MHSHEQIEASQAMENAVAQLSSPLREIAERLDPPTLHTACAAGELHLVRELLDAGLAPDMYPCSDDENDEPPLNWIARYRDGTSSSALEVATLLIERGAGIDEGLPLLVALEAEGLSMTRLLLVAGADPELVFEEASPQQAGLLEGILALRWHLTPHEGGDYYIAFDEDQEIVAVGDSEVRAQEAGSARNIGREVNTERATERLVARFLSGEEVCWQSSGIADLEDQ